MGRGLGAAAAAGPLVSCASCRKSAEPKVMASTRLAEALCSTHAPERKTFQTFPGWPEPWPLGLPPKNLNSSIILGVRATEYKSLRNSRIENEFWTFVKLEFTDFVGWPPFCVR